MNDDHEIDLALRKLPDFDPEPRETRRMESAARAAFEVAHGREKKSLPRTFAGFAVPLGLAAVVVVYLSWAVSAASSLSQ
jgi:hypothetical protein